MIDAVSIIIPTLNEEKYLPKLLASIAVQNFYGNLEVIVVDGHSRDRTIELAKKFKKHILDLKIIITGRGAAYQRNQGAKKAKYRHFLFIDADIILTKNCLNLLFRRIKKNEDFVGFVLHLPIVPNFFDYLTVAFLHAYLFVTQFFEPVTGGSFLYTTAANHQKINGFVEGSILGDDADYGFRSVASGARYYLFFRPHVLGSPRRFRQIGRLRLLLTWTKALFYVRKHGPVFDKKILQYEYGHFK